MASKDEYGTTSEYLQLSESVKMIFELSSRMDERVKMLIDQQTNIYSKVDKLSERDQSLMSRLVILENQNDNGLEAKVSNLETKISEITKEKDDLKIKLSALEIHNTGNMNKWSLFGDTAFKIIMMVAAVVLAWSLGVKP